MNEKLRELIAILEREKSSMVDLERYGNLGENGKQILTGKLVGLDFALKECRKLISK